MTIHEIKKETDLTQSKRDRSVFLSGKIDKLFLNLYIFIPIFICIVSHFLLPLHK
jgi:hypothetical protein